jgi:hypothetical protein
VQRGTGLCYDRAVTTPGSLLCSRDKKLLSFVISLAGGAGTVSIDMSLIQKRKWMFWFGSVIASASEMSSEIDWR